MTERERFEAWHKHEYGFTFAECRDAADRFAFTSRRQAWNAAWQAARKLDVPQEVLAAAKRYDVSSEPYESDVYTLANFAANIIKEQTQ